MDEIPFEKVSVEEAKRSLQGDVVKSEISPPPVKKWDRSRLPETPQAAELVRNTFRWLATLPADVRPHGLAMQYPRIANRFAEIWKRPLQCERYFDSLMIDKRGGRQGFPPAIAAEIAALKSHYLRTSLTMHFGVWGNRIGVD